jgi:multiple sugar transport system permease protein
VTLPVPTSDRHTLGSFGVTATETTHVDGFGKRLSAFVDRRVRVLYPAPAFGVLALLFALPIAYTAYLSLHTWGLSPTRPPLFIGLENYVDIFTEKRFLRAVQNTAYYGAVALPIQLAVGVAMALLFNQIFRGRGVLRTLFLFPMMATPVASMIGWRMMLAPDVGLFGLLTQVGLPPLAPIASETWIIPTMALVDTWQWTPFVTLIVLAGLAVLPSDPFEAARIDGATAWQSFWYITLPLLRPFIVVAMLFRVIDTLKVFETIYVLTGWGAGAEAETLNIYAFREGFEYFHVGYASALLMVFFALIVLLGLSLIRSRRTGATS